MRLMNKDLKHALSADTVVKSSQLAAAGAACLIFVIVVLALLAHWMS